MSKLTPVLIYGVLAVVLLLAVYFFFLGTRNIWRGLASPHWPKTSGQVVNSETSLERTDRNNRDANQYAATISIRYNVSDRKFETTHLYYGQVISSGDSSDAELRHLRYPAGAEVEVSYDPGNPAIAVAEPGFHSESLLLPIAGLALALPCIMAAIVLAGSPIGAGGGSGMAIVAGIFGSIFALLGIGALSLGLINLSRAHASESWPKAPGVIAYQTTDANLGMATTDSNARLIFSYDVAGKKRFANTRRFGLLASDSSDEIERVHYRYPQGQVVTVAYSPDNPNLAVLEPGIDNEAWWLPGIGVALLLFATAVFVFIVPAIASFKIS